MRISRFYQILLVLLLVITVLRIAGLGFTSFRYDTIETQHTWYATTFRQGFATFWSTWPLFDIDYLPGAIYFGTTLKALTNIFGSTPETFVVGLKMFNFLIVVIFALVIHRVHRNYLPAIALYLLPGEWFVSVYWGQWDTLIVLLIYLSFVFLAHNHYFRSGVVLGLALLLKLQPLMFIPVYGFYFIKNPGGKLRFLTGGLLVLFLGLLPAVYFNPIRTLYVYTTPFWRSLKLTSGAYNLWTLFPQTNYSFASSLGSALLIAILIRLFLTYRNHQLKLPHLLYLSSVVNLAYFFLATKMHSRYAHFAALFSVILAMKLPNSLLRYGAFFINIAYFSNQILIFYYWYRADWHYALEPLVNWQGLEPSIALGYLIGLGCLLAYNFNLEKRA